MVIMPPSACTTRWFLGRSFLANSVSVDFDESESVLPISLVCHCDVLSLEPPDELDVVLLIPGITRGMVNELN